MRTYLCHGFIRPHTHSQTLSVHDSCCTDAWEQTETHSSNPRQCHTHFGHPVAIVLAVSDGMDDLEVALQGDDHETDDVCRNPNSDCCRTVKKHANCAVEKVFLWQ